MSDLLAKLTIKADASDTPAVAKRVETALDGVGNSAQRTGAAMAGSEAAAGRMSAGLDRAGDQAQRYEARARGAASATSILNGALGAAALGVFVNDIQKAAFAASGLELGLGAVAGGAAGANAELTFVRQEAARLGLVAQATAKDFLELAASTNGTAIAGAATREIWLSTAEAGMALGRTPEQIGRGLTALGQIAGKGVVSMEEVRQQLAEAIPGAAIIGARAMNLTSAEFNKLVESGKLTSDVFLPAFAAQLREEYGPSIDAYLTSPLGRARQEIGAMQTSLNDLRADAGEGFLEGMTSGLDRLNDTLADGDTADQARAIGEALGEGAAIAANGLVFVVENLDEIAAAAQVIAGIGLVRFLMSTATAAQQAAVAYALKGQAARTSSTVAVAGLASETAATTGLRAGLAAIAAGEVQKAEAALVAAKAHLAVTNAIATEARQTLAATASGVAYTDAKIALTRANAALMAAEAGVATAAGRVAAAQSAATASTTAMAAATTAARGAGSALLGLMGGPWGAAFLAAGGAVWLVADAINDAKDAAANAEANTRSYTDAMLEASDVLGIAAQEAGAFGGENAGAVSGTDALSAATGRLAAETWALADARAEAARQGLLGLRQKLADERAELTNPGWVKSTAGAVLSGAAIATANPGLRNLANIVRPDNSARVAEIDRQSAEALAMATQISLSPTAVTRTSGSTTASAGASGSSGGGRGSRDRSADVLEDLRLEKAALEAHAEALMSGETALDRWRVAQAGVDAVARAGVATTSAAAAEIRAQAEAVERLAIADERIEQATGFVRSAEAEIEALKRRAVAALGGRDALEALRISEAALVPLREAGVTSLEQLDGLERQAVANAIDIATAKERQAIATEKAEAVGASVEQIGEQIAAEERRQASIGRGIEAEVAYARAEFVRQEVERAGLKITDDAAKAIIKKADALFTLRAITDGSQAAADDERELRMMRLSNRERELAVRSETILRNLAEQRLGLTEAELKVIADKRAQADLEAEETAAAIGRITTTLRDEFIKEGSLGFDELADYAEERFRAAIYDAFLAEPINIVVNATVDIVNDLAKELLSGATKPGGWLSGLLGSFGGGAGGFSTAGGGWMGGADSSWGGSFGGGGGLGGLAGLLGPIGTAIAVGQLSSEISGSIAGALGGNAKKGSQWGWLGVVPGLLAGLTDKADRPYARADVEVQGGKFVLAGSQAADGGDRDGIAAAGKALADQLNALAKTFGLDLTKVENLYTTLGKTEGGNAKMLGGDGYFGGGINGITSLDGQRDIKGLTLGRGVGFSQGTDAEAITEQIIRDTILRAINAGASDLSEAEKRFVAAAESLDEAIDYIQTSRNFAGSIDDMLMELLDPAGFEKKKALEAVEATYQALKAEAEKLIGAGLISADVLAKIEELRDLQLNEVLTGAAGGGMGDPFQDAGPRLQAWLDSLAVSDVAPGGPREQRRAAEEQYLRVLAGAQAGDRDALNDLATYADRLLRADRQATGSATLRAELYDKVTGEVAALIDRGTATEPLDPAQISGPIVEALGGSQTALATVLMTLPPETAGPLLAGILRQPDWATRLLGENVQVPPALQTLADRVNAVAPDVAGPIVTAVLTTPQWVDLVNSRLATVAPSIETVRAALDGLPPEVSGPIIAALAATPSWGGTAVNYLQTLPPSLDLLAQLTRSLPAQTAQPIVDALLRDPAWAAGVLQQLAALDRPPVDVAGPIVAALALTPQWGQATADYLATLEPSLDLLGRITEGLPPSIAQPIVDAILEIPGWAPDILDQLRAMDRPDPDVVGPIVNALARTPEWGGQAVEFLRGMSPSFELLRDATRGLPPEITGPIVEALAQTPEWSARLIEDLAWIMEVDPMWAEMLRTAIGEDLSLSIDNLGEVLARLLAQLSVKTPDPDIGPQINPGPGPVAPLPPVIVVPPPIEPPPVVQPPVEPPVIQPPVTGGGGSGGGMPGFEDPGALQRWLLENGYNTSTGGGRQQRDVALMGALEVPALTTLSVDPITSSQPTVGAIEALNRTFEARFTALETTLAAAIDDQSLAIGDGMDRLAAVSADQLDAVRDLGREQRLANASAMARVS